MTHEQAQRIIELLADIRYLLALMYAFGVAVLTAKAIARTLRRKGKRRN